MKNENLSDNSAALKKMFFDLAGMGCLSIALQPFITAAINVGAKKVVEGLSYPVGMREFFQSPLLVPS